MKRLLALCTLSAALLAPQAASARVIELGGKIPKAQVSCPDNCQALTRVTAYQGRGGDSLQPFRVPHSGKVIAFTVRLGKPNASQISFFKTNYGDKPQVALSILKRVATKGKKKYDHQLVAQSDTFDVSNFMGSAPTFTFDKPLNVKPGYIVALTVPTWAPVFAAQLPRNHWWRSSRPKSSKSCKDVAQNAELTKLMSTKTFGCTYFNTRLYYTATYVPYNPETSKDTDATKTGHASSARQVGAKGA
jgi:hypothetical protein